MVSIKKIGMVSLMASMLVACGGGDGGGGGGGGGFSPNPTPAPSPTPNTKENRLKTFETLSGLYQLACGKSTDDQVAFSANGELSAVIKKANGTNTFIGSASKKGASYSLFLENGKLFKLVGKTAPRTGGGGSFTFAGTFKHDAAKTETNLDLFSIVTESNEALSCVASGGASYTEAANLKPQEFRNLLNDMIGNYSDTIYCADSKGAYSVPYKVAYNQRVVTLTNDTTKEQTVIDLNKNVPYNEGYYFLENKSSTDEELDRFEYQASWSTSKVTELSFVFEQGFSMLEFKYPAKSLDCVN